MSADNYIVVYEHDYKKYSGFMFFASEYPVAPGVMPDEEPLWTVNTKEQAIAKCEEETYLEYGYEFFGEQANTGLSRIPGKYVRNKMRWGFNSLALRWRSL